MTSKSTKKVENYSERTGSILRNIGSDIKPSDIFSPKEANYQNEESVEIINKMPANASVKKKKHNSTSSLTQEVKKSRNQEIKKSIKAQENLSNISISELEVVARKEVPLDEDTYQRLRKYLFDNESLRSKWVLLDAVKHYLSVEGY